MTVAISTVSQPINITLGLPSQHLGERGWREGRMGGRMKKKQLDLDVGIEEGLLVAQMQTKKKRKKKQYCLTHRKKKIQKSITYFQVKRAQLHTVAARQMSSYRLAFLHQTNSQNLFH